MYNIFCQTLPPSIFSETLQFPPMYTSNDSINDALFSKTLSIPPRRATLESNPEGWIKQEDPSFSRRPPKGFQALKEFFFLNFYQSKLI